MFIRERNAFRAHTDLLREWLSSGLFQYFHVSRSGMRKNYQELAKTGREFRMHYIAKPLSFPEVHQIPRGNNFYTEMKFLSKRRAGQLMKEWVCNSVVLLPPFLKLFTAAAIIAL